jgi:protein-L-isoaspartate(D-aspartate) O-methyltransferase
MCVALVALCGCSEPVKEEDADVKAADRSSMVDTQIAARGVKDPRVLNALRRVARHRFVPKENRHLAYSDRPLSIGHGQTISQPYIVAYMTEVLNLQPYEKVLEIGTGSGYQAAVLAELCDNVYSIEIVEPLGQRAAAVLDELGYDNVRLKIGDGYKGWPEYAPFDVIIVTCAPNDVPQPLVDQLKDGGRMVIPVGGGGSQELVVLRKTGDTLERQSVFRVLFVPMVDEKGKTY